MFAKRQSGLEIVRVTWFAHEAHLARALLESERIEAWVLDAEQVGVQWHLAGAVGGIKVAVHPDDAERALVVLAEDHSARLAEAAEASLPASTDEQCPSCGSTDIRSLRLAERPSAAGWLAMALFYAIGVLVPRGRRRLESTCEACAHSWTATL